MTTSIKTDICVIGAGSGGLSVAAGAAQMGADVVLFERDRMGGDCLNHGCVPSKSLLAAAKHAHGQTDGAEFGVAPHIPQVDFAAVNRHVREVIAGIEPNDSVERFEGLGVRVIQEAARFTGAREVAGDTVTVRARRFVIATGSRPSVPPILGLDQVEYLTNETIFSLTECPEHLAIIGGGPIGAEMAQAHVRLGARVTVIEAATILSQDDPELVDVVRQALVSEGVALHEGCAVQSVAPGAGGGVTVRIRNAAGQDIDVPASHLLVATGRQANVDDLNLEAAGIKSDRDGIVVDARLRSSSTKVFAIGDAAGRYKFTHMAGYHAGIVIRNALFRLPAKVSLKAVPWSTFTDPELAHVGLHEDEARKANCGVQVVRWPFSENDRARTDRRCEGMVKVVATSKGVVLGASIVGPHAGELIQVWGLAIQENIKLGAVAGMIAPYPTYGEINKRVAGSFFTEKLFSDRVRGIVRFLAKFG